jgi:catechol 2,3-dioxygenase-like lactoylglutathione lyase family enzyme
MFGGMMMAYYVPDPGAAADWYRDRLGLRILADHRDQPPVRFVTVGPASGAWRIIFGDVTVHGEGELADRFRAELGFAPHYLLVCEDLGRTLDDLESRGVEVERPDPAAEGGPPMGHFKDLHGNAISVVDEETYRFFG